MKTIKKNSKKYNEIINSKGWNMFDLYYGFKAQKVKTCNFPKMIKKVQEYDGKYVVTIHSNLWYEKAI